MTTPRGADRLEMNLNRVADELNHWQKIADGLLEQAQHWKQKYEKLVGSPFPGVEAMSEDFAKLRATLKGSVSTRNRAVAEHRKDNAYRYGMHMRDIGKSLEETEKQSRFRSDKGTQTSVEAGWKYIDGILKRHGGR